MISAFRPCKWRDNRQTTVQLVKPYEMINQNKSRHYLVIYADGLVGIVVGLIVSKIANVRKLHNTIEKNNTE